MSFPGVIERARLSAFLDFSRAKRDWGDAKRREENEDTVFDLWRMVKLTRSRWVRIYTYQRARDGR